MSGLWIWLAATAAYIAFRAWYDSWRGPLRPEEIETYLKRLEASELVAAPSFIAAHPFKAAALPNTFSFPTQPTISLYAGPRIWMGLVLALVAALAHLALIGLG